MCNVDVIYLFTYEDENNMVKKYTDDPSDVNECPDGTLVTVYSECDYYFYHKSDYKK